MSHFCSQPHFYKNSFDPFSGQGSIWEAKFVISGETQFTIITIQDSLSRQGQLDISEVGIVSEPTALVMVLTTSSPSSGLSVVHRQTQKRNLGRQRLLPKMLLALLGSFCSSFAIFGALSSSTCEFS